jgi:hypothetical protein
MSGVPPGGNVTIILTGLLGKLWAKAADVTKALKATNTNPERSGFKKCIVFKLNTFISAPLVIGF